MYWNNKPILKEIPNEHISSLTVDDKYSYKICEKIQDMHVLLEFLNKNYHHINDKFRFRYTQKHLEYFLQNGGWLYIYSDKNPNIILGVVAYRQIVLNDSTLSSEVDFLCVRTNIRNVNLASHIIDKVTKILLKKEIYSSFFTGIVNRNIEFYSKKKIYLYILNYEKLRDIKYIPEHNSSKNLQLNNDTTIRECSLEDYKDIVDNYNCLYILEELKKEDCFIDYICQGKFFRFIKIHIVSTTNDVINSAILYYHNCNIDKYIKGISYLLKKIHDIDVIMLYNPFEETNTHVFDTNHCMYYYSYNKIIEATNYCMNPI